MKNFIKISILLLLLLFTIHYRKQITDFIVEKIILKQGVVIAEPNAYQLNYSFSYLQETDDFYAKDQQQLLNIVYTSLNRGASTFYFYCQYDGCEQDITNMVEHKEMSDVNNFLHPYNTYQRLYISINTLRQITVNVERAYTEADIIVLEKKLDEIMQGIITEDMPIKEQIKAFHDYIIHHTKYDQEYVDKKLEDLNHPSHKAIGPLVYGKALCGGYTEVMSIFLNRLQLPNYRISSPYHIWNLVKLDDAWWHIDLTWDDPSVDEDIVLNTFLLVPTDKLQEYNTKLHIFNTEIYPETNINSLMEN